jgi:hypothetical protein
MKEAHYRYQQWGALAKVKDLEERYPQWLVQKNSPVMANLFSAMGATTMMPGTQSHSSNWLDLDSVMKASQTLSGEIVLGKLLANMMQIVIENAGAERGLLLLPQKKGWFIEAEGEIKGNEVMVLQSIAIGESDQLPRPLIHYSVSRLG